MKRIVSLGLLLITLFCLTGLLYAEEQAQSSPPSATVAEQSPPAQQAPVAPAPP